jgi:hypothetical protein
MKTAFKFTVLAGLLFTMMVGMANEPKMKLVSKGDVKSLIFKMDSQSKETAIKFADAQGHIIYSENVVSGGYAKQFDLKRLKDGIYFFTTEDALKSRVYTISISKADMRILEKKENAKPVFRRDKKMVYLNLLNLDGGDVEIKVFDSSNRVLFKQVVEGEISVEKAFNFKRAFADSYSVVVKDNNNTYYESIRID